jgi:hypothetical protein
MIVKIKVSLLDSKHKLYKRLTSAGGPLVKDGLMTEVAWSCLLKYFTPERVALALRLRLEIKKKIKYLHYKLIIVGMAK